MAASIQGCSGILSGDSEALCAQPDFLGLAASVVNVYGGRQHPPRSQTGGGTGTSTKCMLNTLPDKYLLHV